MVKISALVAVRIEAPSLLLPLQPNTAIMMMIIRLPVPTTLITDFIVTSFLKIKKAGANVYFDDPAVS